MLELAHRTIACAPAFLLGRAARDAELDQELLERRLSGRDQIARVERKAEALLEKFESALRVDLALVAALEAIANHADAKDTNLRAEASSIAGFDPFPIIEQEAAKLVRPTTTIQLDPRIALQELLRSVAIRIGRVQLTPILELANLVHGPTRAFAIETLVARVDSCVLRNAELTEPLREVTRLYRLGRIEVAEAARLLGRLPETVAFEFEKWGVTRNIEAITLSEGDRAARVRQALSSSFSESLVRRDTIASQRIEGIDARAHLIREAP